MMTLHIYILQLTEAVVCGTILSGGVRFEPRETGDV